MHKCKGLRHEYLVLFKVIQVSTEESTPIQEDLLFVTSKIQQSSHIYCHSHHSTQLREYNSTNTDFSCQVMR